MRFVDDKHGRIQRFQRSQHARRHQAFRRQVEQLHITRLDLAPGLDIVDAITTGMNRGGGDTIGLQRGDLVIHQRCQRRDHDRHPVQHQRRKLVAD